MFPAPRVSVSVIAMVYRCVLRQGIMPRSGNSKKTKFG